MSYIDTGTLRANPNRRGLLSGLALIGAAAAVHGCVPAHAASPDGELIALCAEFVRIDAEQERLNGCPASDLPYGSPELDAHEGLADAIHDRWWETAQQIRCTRAVTLAGLKAKADALRIVMEGTVCSVLGSTIADLEDHGEEADLIGWSLARDVLAMGGVA